MNYVLVASGFHQVVDDTMVVRYTALASWGLRRDARLEIPTPSLVTAVPDVAASVIADVLAWAATPAGGSITLTKQQVLLDFTPPQISGVRLGSNFATNLNPAFSDVTGLAFDLAPSSHYKFRYRGAYTSAAGTTGLQLAVNGPAAPLVMRGVGVIYTAAGTSFAGAYAAYDTPIAATASGGATPLPFEMEGTISTNAAGGAFVLRARSEINGSAVTLLAGSFGELTRVS